MGTPESLWPGFEGVEDSHHHQQQPLGGGRHKGLATKGQIWSDTFNQALEEAGATIRSFNTSINEAAPVFTYTHLFVVTWGT